MPARRFLTRAILVGIGCLAFAAGCGESVERRELQLADADPFERWLAAVALAHERRGPDERVVDVLIAGLVDPWPSVRSASRRELIAMPWLTVAALTEDLLHRRLSPLDDSAEVLAALLDCESGPADPDLVARGIAFRRAEFVRALARPGAPARILIDQLAPCFAHSDAGVQLFAGACILALDPTGLGLWTRFRTVARDCETKTRNRLTQCVLALWQGLDRPQRRAQVEFVRGRMLEVPAETVPALARLAASADDALRRDALLCLLGAAVLPPPDQAQGVEGDPPGSASELQASDAGRRARAALRAAWMGAHALPSLAALQAAAHDPAPAVRMLAHVARSRMERELAERGLAFRPTGGGRR